MKHLIDKDALVEEIDRIVEFWNLSKSSDGRAFIETLHSFINSFEVKEVDLENSMVCKVDWYDGFLLDYTQEQQDELLEKIGANVGDKIRVILIKE